MRTFQEIPIELFGMMDDSEYVKNYRKKMNTYINNGYIPGINMLTFYESQKAPLNQITLNKKLEDFFFMNRRFNCDIQGACQQLFFFIR